MSVHHWITAITPVGSARSVRNERNRTAWEDDATDAMSSAELSRSDRRRRCEDRQHRP